MTHTPEAAPMREDVVPVTQAGTEVKCEACGVQIPETSARTDDNGFTGCRPCFPVSNDPSDSDRFMRGPCYRGNANV